LQEALRRGLFYGRDEVLLELAVGVGVCGEDEALAGVDDLKDAKGHAASEFFLGLVEEEGFAEW
jgi:hypothetical protein